jgi:flavin reductase (DIM6/NTAB) family NADH-FMN oxidoreductase RutF
MAEQHDQRQVKAILDRLDTTGCIVTTAFAGSVDGCYVSFIAPCSIEPHRLLVMTSHTNLTHTLIDRSGVLAVHPVARGQEDWVEHFGRQTGKEVVKLASVAWHAGVTGAPILERAVACIKGRVLASMDCGDHTARLVEPVAAVLRDPAAVPLTVFELIARGLLGAAASSGAPWSSFAPRP